MPKAFLDASSSIETVYDFAYDDNHVLQVVEKGTEDRDAYIQTFADSCGMEFVLRSVAAGDMSVLNARSGSYGDFTNAPQTLAEVSAYQDMAAESFSNLPDDIKNGRSPSDVISLTKEQLDEYIKKAIDAQIQTTMEDNNNE